ncbi:hypothetical protein CfE428DRAFT_6553 [Chthoniobacter flavus Ellin428]|uniref:Uncharacterized protein n=1 Tax=Chthoniobacter flavus Ellin428 TaxID=497964 RepID=B4DCB2_9BACT|nr:hypothetical protein [Chthoniobacter flavus]EDY15942.1 hypothetical protein CfE428DRAFT_6553 [Chthoniobacter flavus Ellin428]
MAKYLISFPSAAMVVPDGEWEAVGRDAHAVIDEAKAADVYVFGGGIDEAVPPVLVSADGAVAEGGYPWGSPAQRRLYRARTALTRPGGRVGRAHRKSLPLQTRTPCLRVRSAVLKIMDLYYMDGTGEVFYGE